MKNELESGVLFPRPFSSSEDASRFLALLFEEFPALSPEFFGNYEPVRTPFSSIQSCVSSWKSPFLWTRREPASLSGTVFMDERTIHIALFLQCRAVGGMGQDLCRFLPRVARLQEPDFGYVHLLGEQETRRPDIPYEAWHSFQAGITTHQLRKGIPALAWGTLLGPPYVELIGTERVAATPAFRVERRGGGCFIQLTERIEDLIHSFDEFHARRIAAMRHLGSDLFMDPPAGVVLRTPVFSFDRGPASA